MENGTAQQQQAVDRGPSSESRTRWAYKFGEKPKEKIWTVYAKDQEDAYFLFKKAGLTLRTSLDIVPFGGIVENVDGTLQYVWPEGYEPVLHADNAPSRETRT
jgi:hypothetical protein